MMDANIDFLKWTRDDLPVSDSTHKLRPLIIQFFSKIFPHGVSQLVSTATRTWPRQADSGLDHILIWVIPPSPEMEYCASAASMLAEEIWHIAEGFVEVSANL